MSQKDWKTVKEIAYELKMSRETVRRKVLHLPQHMVARSSSGAWQISGEGVDIIASQLATQTSTQASTAQQRLEEKQGTDVLQLQKQIDFLQAQLIEKDRQIAGLQEAIKALQIIALQTQQLLEADNQKPSFWKRIIFSHRDR